jgi:hypothetical protein
MTESERLLIHAAISESIACRREGRPYDPKRIESQLREELLREAAVETFARFRKHDVRRHAAKKRRRS